MSELVELLVDCDDRGIRLLPANDGGLTIDAPQCGVPLELMERLKLHKAGLLSILNTEPITPETRQEMHATMIERANAAYRGGPIDWPQLDSIERRIETAETLTELRQAVADYVRSVPQRNNAGQIGQHCVWFEHDKETIK